MPAESIKKPRRRQLFTLIFRIPADLEKLLREEIDGYESTRSRMGRAALRMGLTAMQAERLEAEAEPAEKPITRRPRIVK